jgi:hypothetical protein
VVTGVSYTPANPETLIWNLGMFDPWPGIGMRGLSDASEIVSMSYGGSMTYLALAEILP